MASANATDCLQHLLNFHQRVQRSRRGGGSWLRPENDKLVMQVAGYSGYKSEVAFPSLKLGVVRRLLADLGRLE
jgi:stalled ribosome alternative rescue factor ArfA